MNDRIRAKPPTTDIEQWTEGTVVAVETSSHVTVTVETEDEEVVELTITDAVYNLFSGRLDEGEAIGATAYFIKKSE